MFQAYAADHYQMMSTVIWPKKVAHDSDYIKCYFTVLWMVLNLLIIR